MSPSQSDVVGHHFNAVTVDKRSYVHWLNMPETISEAIVPLEHYITYPRYTPTSTIQKPIVEVDEEEVGNQVSNASIVTYGIALLVAVAGVVAFI